MYSWEILNLLSNANYSIDSNTYLYILKTSPQIRSVSYDAFSDYFEIIDDNCIKFRFKVYKGE